MSTGELVWQAAPHTLAKIRIVEEYLKAWLPILSNRYREIVYVDGFAGPGEYEGGYKGSPVVALEAAVTHKRLGENSKIFLYFVEKKPDHLSHLEELLRERSRKESMPLNIEYRTFCGDFSEFFEKTLLGHLGGHSCVPTFLFLDPFGIEGLSYDQLKKFMSYPSCEILVNFMYKYINRYEKSPTWESRLDALYGTPEWRACSGQELVSLYVRRLRRLARHVWSFRMVGRDNQDLYYLFFATKNDEGLRAMKRAMWKVQPRGDFRFSDREAGQVYLFDKPDFAHLGEVVCQKLRGRTVDIREVERFTLEETDFLEAHVRRALDPLREAGRLTVTPNQGKGRYPAGTRLTFLE